jgi:hypothetical protein
LFPFLFFTKTQLRTLAAYMTCWQGRHIWLFTMRLPAVKFDTIMLLAIAQRIFLAMIAQVTIAQYKSPKADSLKNLEGLFETNHFAAIFRMSAMVFLAITPLIFIHKKTCHLCHTRLCIKY